MTETIVDPAADYTTGSYATPRVRDWKAFNNNKQWNQIVERDFRRELQKAEEFSKFTGKPIKGIPPIGRLLLASIKLHDTVEYKGIWDDPKRIKRLPQWKKWVKAHHAWMACGTNVI